MRFLASIYNSKGIRLEQNGDSNRAIAAYHRAIRWDRRWSVPWALVQASTQLAGIVAAQREAVALNPTDEAAWWNLGIAATALGNCSRAREAWRACGIDVPSGDGPIEMDLGSVPVRLNPDADAEVVWCQRIDPARAIIWNVPLPESAHRCGDLLLHDGAPKGSRVRNGVEIPVFDEIALLQPSELGTFVVTISGLTALESKQFVERAEEQQLHAEDWSSDIQWICPACSEGKVEHSHDESTQPPERRIGIAAPSEAHVRQLIESVLNSSPGAILQSVECAILPLSVQ